MGLEGALYNLNKPENFFSKFKRFATKTLTASLISSMLLFSCKDKSGPTQPNNPQPRQNNLPVISSSPQTQINENEYYSYYVSASDADEDSLEYSLTEKPNWISISGNAIQGTAPEVLQNQTNPIKLEVSDGKGGVANQNYNLTIVNTSNILKVPENQLAQISNINENSIAFSQPVNFSQGDVLVAGISGKTPYGFLREITGISGDKKTIQTKNSNLERIIKNSTFSKSGSLSPQGIRTQGTPSGISEIYSTDEFSFNIDFEDVILEERFGELSANGNLSFNVDYNLEARARNKLDYFLFQLIMDERADLKLTSTRPLYAPSLDKTIAAYNFMPIVVQTPLGLPVVITPKLDILVGLISGGAVGIFEARVVQSANLSPGIVYENNSWRTLSEFSNSFASSVPDDLSDFFNVDMNAYAGSNLKFLLYELLPGPQAGIQSNLKLQIARDIDWKLYGGLGALVGVDMNIFSEIIPDLNRIVIDHERVLRSGIFGGGGEEGKILFRSMKDWDPEGYTGFYLIDANGSNLNRIPNTSNSEDYASWFPDKTKIAFHSDRDGNYEIYTMDIDGTNLRRLTFNSELRSNNDFFPNLSPNGQEILFVSNRGSSQYNNLRIFLMNSNGTNQRELNTGSPYDQHDFATWSPNGQRIAYSVQGDRDYSIFIINRDGTNKYGLLSKDALGEYDGYSPQWSPDGTKIVFDSFANENREIYIINSDGSGLRNLTNNASLDGHPSWSPDGSKIVFISDRDIEGYNDIYTMNPDGSNPRILFKGNHTYESNPMWSPR